MIICDVILASFHFVRFDYMVWVLHHHRLQQPPAEFCSFWLSDSLQRLTEINGLISKLID